MNFKKSIALLTALLMLVSNAGFALTVHYCGGTLASVSSGFNAVEHCETKKVEVDKACCATKPVAKEIGHKKCCTDKTVQFKRSSIEMIAKFSTVEASPAFLAPIVQIPVAASAPTADVVKLPSYHCEVHAPPLHQLYHQYIFYA